MIRSGKSSSSPSLFTLFTSDEQRLRTRVSSGAAPVAISVANDLVRLDSSRLLQFVCQNMRHSFVNGFNESIRTVGKWFDLLT